MLKKSDLDNKNNSSSRSGRECLCHPSNSTRQVVNLYEFICHLGKRTGTKSTSDSWKPLPGSPASHSWTPPEVNPFDDFMNSVLYGPGEAPIG